MRTSDVFALVLVAFVALVIFSSSWIAFNSTNHSQQDYHIKMIDFTKSVYSSTKTVTESVMDSIESELETLFGSEEAAATKAITEEESAPYDQLLNETSPVIIENVKKWLAEESHLATGLKDNGYSGNMKDEKLKVVSAARIFGGDSNGNGIHPAVPDSTSYPEDNEEKLNGISCRKSYEPTCDMYNYVRFWNRRFVESDCQQSPLRVKIDADIDVKNRKYLLFEPDRGGWNNIRMAAETAMIIAHSSGRILVLPPEEKWYLLDKNNEKEKEKENLSTFNSFFDLSKLSESMTIISMKEYLETMAKSGSLKSRNPLRMDRVAQLGKNPRTGWLWQYLEETSYVRQWEPGKMFFGFNLTSNPANSSNVEKVVFGTFDEPSTQLRARKVASHPRLLVPYDREMHSYRSIYFPGDYRSTHRILTHFYSYIFWADKKQEHFYKRLVRDRLVMCC